MISMVWLSAANAGVTSKKDPGSEQVKVTELLMDTGERFDVGQTAPEPDTWQVVPVMTSGGVRQVATEN